MGGGSRPIPNARCAQVQFALIVPTVLDRFIQQAVVTRLLTTKLKLRVNSEKSAVARPWERKFLGFSFTNHKQPKRRLAPKAVARFKERVRELTSRTRGISLVRMVHDLAEYLRGWIGYFGRCETPEVLAKLEKWLRHRLRSMVWKQ